MVKYLNEKITKEVAAGMYAIYEGTEIMLKESTKEELSFNEVKELMAKKFPEYHFYAWISAFANCVGVNVIEENPRNAIPIFSTDGFDFDYPYEKQNYLESLAAEKENWKSLSEKLAEGQTCDLDDLAKHNQNARAESEAIAEEYKHI